MKFLGKLPCIACRKNKNVNFLCVCLSDTCGRGRINLDNVSRVSVSNYRNYLWYQDQLQIHSKVKRRKKKQTSSSKRKCYRANNALVSVVSTYLLAIQHLLWLGYAQRNHFNRSNERMVVLHSDEINSIGPLYCCL